MLRLQTSRAWLMPLLVVLAASARPAHADQPKASAPVATIVQRIQQRYDATRDFTAEVTQEMRIASLGKTLTSRGTVYFRRPGKMRWQLEGGDGQAIVADGTTLWLYQPEERQVLKAPFSAAFRASTPISFLLGVGRIADDFDVSTDANDDASDGTLTWLKLVPRQGDGTLGWLRLGVDPHSFDIVAAEIHDPLGNQTRLQFAHLKRDAGLKDSLFQFTVPNGVDVVEAPIGF